MTAAQLRTRASYADLALYAPDRRPCAIDLSDNTNLWGMPPAAERAIRDAASSTVTRYPEVYAQSLKCAIATYAGVEPASIVTGCGSDDVLDSAIRAFAEPGDRIAIPDPSFAMMPAFAHMNALAPVFVPLTADYDADVDGMIAADAAIVYLCSPNNPTGTALSRSAIERIAAHARGVVIIDEAYAEFARCSMVDLAMGSGRVLIVRTMSKAFGLAGLRIGYAIGHPALVAEVEKSRGPYKTNALAERAALAALGTDMDWVRARVHAAVEMRGELVRALQDLGLSPLPSHANFVLVPLAHAAAVAAALRARGIAVRPFEGLRAPAGSALASTGGCALRITVAPWPLLDQALGALREVLP